MNNIKYVCPCLMGVESLVAEELRSMGASFVEAQNGRVVFNGNLNILARSNICSRYSERVLILLGSFKSETFDELFESVKDLPFENWILKNDAFPVKGSSINSKLTSVPACQKIIKKAVVDRLKQKYKVNWFEETGEIHQIQFLIMKNQVSIMIDTSGQGLHKRGYRETSVLAPIKETLAASMVKLAHIREDANIIDPFCGSGTILIEAMLYAMNIAPGLNRRFQSEYWSAIPKEIFKVERERARDLIKNESKALAYGYDISAEALDLTNINAKKAGVGKYIKLCNQSINKFNMNENFGTVICNPPYGERLLDKQKAKKIYMEMGKAFCKKKGWSYYIISPDDNFENYFGRKADKRRKLYNGMIKCQLYMYFKN